MGLSILSSRSKNVYLFDSESLHRSSSRSGAKFKRLMSLTSVCRERLSQVEILFFYTNLLFFCKVNYGPFRSFCWVTYVVISEDP